MDQRRLLLAFVISLLLIVAYQEFVLSRYKSPQPPPSKVAAPVEPPLATPPPTPTPAGDLAAPIGEGESVTVDTDVLRVVITPVGARLADVELKAYRRTVAPDSEPLGLVQPAPVLPGTLQIGPKASDAAVVYRPDRTTLAVHGSESGEVVFLAEDAGGVRIEKRYRFRGNEYLFDIATAVSGSPRPASLGLVLTPPAHDVTDTAGPSALALADRKMVHHAIPDLLKGSILVEKSSWAGFAAQYFLVAAIAPSSAGTAVFTATDGSPIVRIDAPLTEKSLDFAIYAGPKDREDLARADHALDRALDFGWFWFIAIPLLQALRFLHGLTGNFGVAIIVLTALVKLATAPLTQTTFRNMREMQKIQPQMQKLRERFKDDQVAMQKEMMELYRRHRVNPFSGCLPMVLQIPIFVGLYNALSHAIELRHAPFALWINDLSAPDRLMIGGIGVPVLTLLMGASMFVQQWLTPAQGDPAQQRMMMFMPLVFTFMFINFPSGLVLYWLVNNVLTIGQQYLMMRKAT